MYCDFPEFDLELPSFDLEREPEGAWFDEESGFVSSPVAQPFEFDDHGVDSFPAQAAPPPKPQKKKKIASAVFRPFERLEEAELTVRALNKFINQRVLASLPIAGEFVAGDVNLRPSHARTVGKQTISGCVR